MTKTIKIPISLSPQGTLNTVSGTKEIDQAVKYRLLPAHSINPFDIQNEIGIDEENIFSINNKQKTVDIKKMLIKKFISLEVTKRAKLFEHTIKVKTENEKLIVYFQYFNYEDNKTLTKELIFLK